MIYSASLAALPSDKLDGYYPIYTREELDKLVAKVGEYNKVILRGDFVEQNFTPSGVVDYINNSKLVNPNLIFELDADAECYSPNQFVRKMMGVESLTDLIGLAVKNEKQFLSAYHDIVSETYDLNTQLVRAGSKISRQQEIHDSLRAEIESLKSELVAERRNKVYISNTLSILLGRINNQYNKAIDRNRLFIMDRNGFDKIVYIKELSRVQYTDSLVYYLREILRVMYSLPVRSLVIEGYYATGKVPLYPDYVSHYSLRERDVISGDILMLGNQPNLMKDILKNPSNVSFLIVLDRAGHDMPHIIGDNVEYFYTVSDDKDKPEKIPNARTIGYTDDTLNIPLIPKFESLDSSKRISKYSSMDIVKKILSTLNI